ncbi:MAG: hypothetical protein WCF85_04520 [Rhodospirillaceae bacterium]
MPYVLADTGFWYAAFDGRDSYAAKAVDVVRRLETFQIILPWPILYETLGTRFVRNEKALRGFNRYLKRPGVNFLDDQKYRQQAFDDSLYWSLEKGRPMSMVDCAIRLMIQDRNVKIDYFVTFNPADFADVCQKSGIEMDSGSGDVSERSAR